MGRSCMEKHWKRVVRELFVVVDPLPPGLEFEEKGREDVLEYRPLSLFPVPETGSQVPCSVPTPSSSDDGESCSTRYLSSTSLHHRPT